jgi:hypothetical protein
MDNKEIDYALEIELGRIKSCLTWQDMLEKSKKDSIAWYEFKNKPAKKKYLKGV